MHRLVDFGGFFNDLVDLGYKPSIIASLFLVSWLLGMEMYGSGSAFLFFLLFGSASQVMMSKAVHGRWSPSN